MKSREVKNLKRAIYENYHFEFEQSYVYLISSKNKIYILIEGVKEIDFSNIHVINTGLYIGEWRDDGFRCSVEGSQFIGPTAEQNVLEINDEQARKWLKGEDLEIDSEISGFVIVCSNSDFLGGGKVAQKKLYNYVPKARRVMVD